MEERDIGNDCRGSAKLEDLKLSKLKEMMKLDNKTYGEGTFYVAAGKHIELILSKFLDKQESTGISTKSGVARLLEQCTGNVQCEKEHVA